MKRRGKFLFIQGKPHYGITLCFQKKKKKTLGLLLGLVLDPLLGRLSGRDLGIFVTLSAVTHSKLRKALDGTST